MNEQPLYRNQSRRKLCLSKSDSLREYNERIEEVLEKYKIIYELEKARDREHIGSLVTKVGRFDGLLEIQRYAEALHNEREKHEEKDSSLEEIEPSGILDSDNCMHFPNVIVQCAPASLVKAMIELQKERYKELMAEKNKKL